MELDTRLLYFTKFSGKSQDFYFLVGIHLKREVDILSEIDALIQSIHLRLFSIVQTYA